MRTLLVCFVSLLFATQLHANSFQFTQNQAEKGDANAQLALGDMYYFGDVVTENLPLALKWYQLAAEQGQVDAQYYLGMMHENGDGVAVNTQFARKWYQLAAKQGHAEAQFRLADIMMLSDTKEDEQRAFYWYMQAAKQGHANAQSHLGLMYYLGRGVDANMKFSYIWASIASHNGFHYAKEFINNYAMNSNQRLAENERIEAEAISLECYVSHYKNCQF